MLLSFLNKFEFFCNIQMILDIFFLFDSLDVQNLLKRVRFRLDLGYISFFFFVRFGLNKLDVILKL